MRQLVQHFLQTDLQQIVDNSLLNCHAKGLHSILFCNTPGKIIRLFICVPDNEMYLNFPELSGSNNMTIGFHAHHCDLTLHCIKGKFLNWEVEVNAHKESFVIKKWSYQSKIKTGEIKFVEKAKTWLKTKKLNWINENESVFMRAEELHSVGCHYDKLTAWFVYEGQENIKYDSVIYSNSNLDKKDNSQLYKKPTQRQVLQLLNMIDLLPENLKHLITNL